VRHAVNAHQIRANAIAGSPFVQTSPAADGAWTVARHDNGACVFLDEARGPMCAIHDAAGPEALPSACRHFPRRILRDRRGTFISLSHFCPTAAAMLFEPDPLQIVEAHAPLRLEEPVEGMDARHALPPLVRPGVLCDLDGYDAWERACIAAFARPGASSEQALDRVADATEQVRRWQPGTCSLTEQVDAAFVDARHERGADPHAQTRTMHRVRSLSDASVRNDVAALDVIGDDRPDLMARSPERLDLAMRNFLAARVFGNWLAYQARGLRSIVEWLRTCAAAVRHHLLRQALANGSPPADADLLEAFRMADLLLLHAIDTQAFARHVTALEGPGPR
jgi:hypothetical protein